MNILKNILIDLLKPIRELISGQELQGQEKCQENITGIKTQYFNYDNGLGFDDYGNVVEW